MNVSKYIIVALAVCVITTANAADAPTIESLTAAQSDKLTPIFGQQQRNLGDGCSQFAITRAKAIQVTSPLVLNAQNQPTAGQWSVRFALNVCGQPALRMAQFTITPKGIAIDALTPGETLADPKLQKDVLKSFALAGRVIMPNCTEIPVIRNTKLQIAPATPKDRWVELWIGRMCGRDVGQTVDFMPSKSGTVFKMSLPNATAK